MKHTPPSRVNQINRGVTEGRVAELVTAGVLAAASQIYDQIGDKTVENLRLMESVVVERVLRELHERTWRVRAWRWFRRTVLRRTPLAIVPPLPTLAPAIDGPRS